MYRRYIFSTLLLVAVVFMFPNEANAFVQQSLYTTYSQAGFFAGIWHGLLAPWSLIARWFISDIGMYAINNTGWFYDAGFLLGVTFSIPAGWLAAIASTIGHLFF